MVATLSVVVFALLWVLLFSLGVLGIRAIQRLRASSSDDGPYRHGL